MRLSELKQKEIIDIDSGIRLGRISECELSFDVISGRLIDLMIPKQEDTFLFFGKNDVQLIKWECVRKISDDFVLIGSYDRSNR